MAARVAAPLTCWAVAILLLLATLVALNYLVPRTMVRQLPMDGSLSAAAKAVLLAVPPPQPGRERLIVVIGTSLSNCAFAAAGELERRLSATRPTRIVVLAGGGVDVAGLGEATEALLELRPDLILVQDEMLLPAPAPSAELWGLITGAGDVIRAVGRALLGLKQQWLVACGTGPAAGPPGDGKGGRSPRQGLAKRVQEIGLLYRSPAVDALAVAFLAKARSRELPTALLSIARAPSLEAQTGDSVAAWRERVAAPTSARLGIARWSGGWSGEDADYPDGSHLGPDGAEKFAAAVLAPIERALRERE